MFEGSVISDGGLAEAVDLVHVQPVLGSLGIAGGVGLGQGEVGLHRSHLPPCSVGAFLVVDLLEECQELVEFGQCSLCWVFVEPFLLSAVESFDLALGLGVVPRAVLLSDAEARLGLLETIDAAIAQQSGGVKEPVVRQSRGRCAVFVACCQELFDHDEPRDGPMGGAGE